LLKTDDENQHLAWALLYLRQAKQRRFNIETQPAQIHMNAIALNDLNTSKDLDKAALTAIKGRGD
jgi:hypothetical protein